MGYGGCEPRKEGIVGGGPGGVGFGGGGVRMDVKSSQVKSNFIQY